MVPRFNITKTQLRNCETYGEFCVGTERLKGTDFWKSMPFRAWPGIHWSSREILALVVYQKHPQVSLCMVCAYKAFLLKTYSATCCTPRLKLYVLH
jgi:hypothetical protein